MHHFILNENNHRIISNKSGIAYLLFKHPELFRQSDYIMKKKILHKKILTVCTCNRQDVIGPDAASAVPDLEGDLLFFLQLFFPVLDAEKN